MFCRNLLSKLSIFLLGFCIASTAAAKNYIYTPDGRSVAIKGGFSQPDLSDYRSPIESKVVDRRFYTNEATFMANEGFKTGMEGYNDMVKAAFPVAYKRAFQWVTAREMYFYARYLLDYIGGRTHSGIHMVHGPYWTLKALEHSQFNRLIRDRGERTFSNKDILMGVYLPMVYQRTGFPRIFDNVQPTYLQYKSVQPEFSGKLDNTDSFDDAMSGKVGGWGVPNTFFNDSAQVFSHDEMDTTFNLGAMGQFVKRRAQWLDRFYQAKHNGKTRVSNGVDVELLGNDAEEGMRGWGLTMSALNEILQVKSAMFTDGEKLMGINPEQYDPKNGLKYLPHEIKPNIIWVGDIPERVWSMDLKDASSQLWDQASWIWATSAYAVAANRRGDMFTDNPPVDGGMVEKSTGLLAEALGNVVFKNIETMHQKNGLLVSEWTPGKGKGQLIGMKDLTMAMVALRDLEQSWKLIGRHAEIRDRAMALLQRNGDFLLKVQEKNGAFREDYSLNRGIQVGELSANANWAGIRALLAVYQTTSDKKYLAAARKTFNLMNAIYWVHELGIYKSHLNKGIAIVDSYSVGIAMAAMREMMFATPTYNLEPQIERMTRWWIQTVNQSGLLQAEHQSTGEVYTGFGNGDDDGDGIPYVSKAHGQFGSAPVMAAKVVINLGEKDNTEFKQIEGELHYSERFSKVVMNYQPSKEQAVLQVSLIDPIGAGIVSRKPMQRTDGAYLNLPPSKPIHVGMGTVNRLTGKQIYEANCMLCHGQHGEGLDGKPLNRFMKYPAVVMEQFVKSGNPTVSMPAWGLGNGDDVGGALTELEIKKVVAYVSERVFQK